MGRGGGPRGGRAGVPAVRHARAERAVRSRARVSGAHAVTAVAGHTPAIDTGGASAVRPCAHCAARVPRGMIEPGAAEQFCCGGCRAAYHMIMSSGLSACYRLRDRFEPVRAVASGPEAGAADGAAFEGFDSPAYAQRAASGEGDSGLLRVEWVLENVRCAACVWLVERLPRLCPGVAAARLDLGRGVAQVVWDPSRVRLSAVARALAGIGYRPHALRDESARRARARQDRAAVVRVAVAGACAGNAMLFAVALYAGMFAQMEPAHRDLFRAFGLLVTLVCVLWPGRVFFAGAWGALRARSPHLDVPIALAIAVGTAWSVRSTLLGTGEVYSDSLSMLVFVLLCGRMMQRHQQRWACDAVELLLCLTPSIASVVHEAGADGSGGSLRRTPIDAVRAGDLVHVEPGQTFPADGELMPCVGSAGTEIDAALLTGESRPQRVVAGGRVCAGTVNLASAVRVRVTAAGDQTRAAGLMRMVERASRSRPPIVQLTDRAAGWFTVVMIIVGLATLGAWLAIDASQAAARAVAVMVVACPCALGLATPMTISAALGRAARGGVLIKDAAAIERLSSRGTVYFDKTGTLTAGRPRVLRTAGDRRALERAAALDHASDHPSARALRDWAGDAAGAHRVDSARATLGAGVTGVVGGAPVSVGKPTYVYAACPGADRLRWGPGVEAAEREGLSVVLVAERGRVVAMAALGDEIRPDARQAVAALGAKGWSVAILSGDAPGPVRAVADAVGIDAAHSRMSPEDKLARVRDWRPLAGPGQVRVMVGDGVNDAAALAAADVGIAVHGGAEASLAAADVYLSRPTMAGIAAVFRGCRRTVAAVRTNLIVSVSYNVLAVAAAAVGLIGPLGAAVLMPISSLTVLALALRARTFGGPA
ncbi:MAG: hypothetical protein C0475_07945 [Planctomyces sp.]|nr:hypothetical protein [Planctomyces sp.]MBA4039622.1 hypothetical protein [Planctomyces sp.]